MLLGMSTAVVGLYGLIAVLAYFGTYTHDLAALEGAPEPVRIENPTGWIGAKLAHLLIYRGFGWIGILFPIALVYAGLSWLKQRPIRKKYLVFGLLTLYFFSTLGGVLVQIRLVEDLLWCGVVGAAFSNLLALYIGKVGLLLTWLGLVGGAGYSVWRWAKRFSEAKPTLTQEETTLAPTPKDQKAVEETAEKELLSYTLRPIEEASEQAAPSALSKGDAATLESIEAIVAPASALDLGLQAPEPSNAQRLRVLAKPEGDSIKETDGLASEQAQGEEALLESLPSSKDRPTGSLPLPLASEKEEGRPFEWMPSSRKEKAHEPQPLPLSGDWSFPALELLEWHERSSAPLPSPQELALHKQQIVETLAHYGIQITRISATVGPTVTLFEIVPAPGIRISRIRSLEDDIALSLSALGIRIVAPLPGKGTVGIEVPHREPQTVSLRSLLQTEIYQKANSRLPLALGKTITNEVYVRDLAQMPHLLIAGATGQGKSVALNCMILSLLYRLAPDQIRFLLIDPKKVEMSLYQHLASHYLVQIPGLTSGIITEVEEALPALQSLVLEMESRYDLLKEARVRNLVEYNEAWLLGRLLESEGHRYLPYVVLIIDELADLIMTAGKEVETPICRLAQLARAVGIHLILATQRPSVNVITGLIKANFPVRLSFRVSSSVDSRTILDTNGAERLIGRGDMLFMMGTELIRLQSGLVTTAEIERVIAHIAHQKRPTPYILPEPPKSERGEAATTDPEERDPLFYEAALLVVRNQYGSTSLLQRKLGIGFNRAGRLMDQLERAGIVGPGRGSKPREVLIQDESLLEPYR